MTEDFYCWMGQALEEADMAFRMDEVPVGALVISPEGRIIARAHNQPIRLNDPTAHAEILALREAGTVLRNYRLIDCTLVVTIEPCLMCMGALVHARVARLVFGAHDPRAGAAGSLYDVGRDSRLNHRIEIVSGILKEACQEPMQRFFKARRGV